MASANSSSTPGSTAVPLWINGKERLASSTFDVITPADNSVCWTASAATKEDAILAVEAAQVAFNTWSKTKPAVRTAVLLKAAERLEQNVVEYAGYMATEMGAQVPVAQYFVVPLAIQMLRDIAGRVSRICGSVPVCAQEGQSCIVYKEPYGVTLGIVPWNAPYVFGIRSAATAIATGNTTILKASELTPKCYWAIGKAFADAGLPAGVLNIISCPPKDAAEVVNTMIQHSAVKHINFTGSANIGRKIARECGQNLKPCLMELGGKNSAIVLQDADLEKTAQECINGSFLNAGQICMATDRIIAHSAIADELLKAIKTVLQSSEKGPPPQSVVSTASRKRLDSLVTHAIEKGAQVIHGKNGEKRSPETAEFLPTILGGVQKETEFWNEESFGPLVAFVKVDSEDEAIQIANSTGYGLSAAVFTKDLRKGLAVARRLESGAVHINSMTIQDEPALPFGGVKNSGWGRFNAEEGMNEFLVTKSVTWDD